MDQLHALRKTRGLHARIHIGRGTSRAMQRTVPGWFNLCSVVQLPHHRADCPTVQKDSVAINWTKASDAEKLGAHCPQCLCLICPESGGAVALASACPEWRTHCLAFDDGEGGHWRTLRRTEKEKAKADAAAAAAAARGAGAGAAASSGPNGAKKTGARRRAPDKVKHAPPGTAKPPGKVKKAKKLAVA